MPVLAIALAATGCGCPTSRPVALQSTDEMTREADDASQLLAKGLDFFNQGEFQASLPWFERSIAADPNNLEAQLMLARALRMIGRANEAEASLTAAINKDRAFPGALVERASLYVSKKEFRKAYEDLNEHFRLGRGGYDAYMLAAIASLQLRRPLEAINHAEAAAQVTGAPHEPYTLLAQIYAADPDEDVRNGTLALQHAQFANDMTNEQNALALAALAMAYAELGQFESALRWQETAIEAASNQHRPQLLKHRELYESRQPFRHTYGGD